MSSNASQHVLPHNLEAEQAVLGSILVDATLLDEIIDTVRAEDFYNPKHEKIFASMLALAKADEPIDTITLANKAHNIKPEATGELFSYLTSLLDIVPCSEDIVTYAKIVREKSDLRAIIHAAAEMTKAAYAGEDNVERAFSDADATWRLACDRKGSAKGPVDLAKALRRNYERITDIMEGVAVSNVQKTPWREMNEYLGGFSPGNMVVWAAAPKAGKSGAVLVLADYVAAHYGSVFYASLEVPTDEMVMRYGALYSGVSVRRQLEGKLSDKELSALVDAEIIVSKRKVELFGRERCRSLADIRAEMRSLKRTNHISAVVIDGLNFIREADPSGPHARASKNDCMDALYREILTFASDNQVVVHVVTHINREGQKGGHPRASDIRDGGNPEGHAHAIIMPYRPNADSNVEAEREEGEFVIAAARIGSQGAVPMSFKLGRGLWLDRDTLRPWFETENLELPAEALEDVVGW